MITRKLRTIYSERGTSERVKEETTFMLFLDLLHECEGNFIIFIVHEVFQIYAHLITLMISSIFLYYYIATNSPGIFLGILPFPKIHAFALLSYPQ